MAQFFIASGKVKTLQAALTVTGCTTGGAATVASTTGWENGDLFIASGLVGLTGGANAIWQATVTSGTVITFKSIGTGLAPTFGGTWTSGGTLTHIGFVTAALTLDNTVFVSPNPDWTLRMRVEALSASTGLRMHVLDTGDAFAADIKPGPMQYAFGFLGTQQGLQPPSDRVYDFQGLRLGNANNALKAVTYFEGANGAAAAVGSSATFSYWIEA